VVDDLRACLTGIFPLKQVAGAVGNTCNTPHFYLKKA
jgi:hypothetical protein